MCFLGHGPCLDPPPSYCAARRSYCVAWLSSCVACSIAVSFCRAGRVTEGNMGTLVFVCPATGTEVSTGIGMELETLHQLEPSKVYCPNCLQQHQMAVIRYWLTPLELL